MSQYKFDFQATKEAPVFASFIHSFPLRADLCNSNLLTKQIIHDHT